MPLNSGPPSVRTDSGVLGTVAKTEDSKAEATDLDVLLRSGTTFPNLVNKSMKMVPGSHYKLLMPACNTDIKRRFFGARCVLLWNSLPTCVMESDSLVTFKRLLAEFLGDVLFEFV